MIKTYSELIEINSFVDRYRYLKIKGYVGKDKWGSDRFVNQMLYRCPEWRDDVRPQIILRDNGCDLGIPGREIDKGIIVHHIEPITLDDILQRRPNVFDSENLICTSLKTHNAIHYGDESGLLLDPVERRPNDTKLWR